MKVIEVGFSCTPSKFIEKKESKVKEFKVSQGGGMGGSRYEYYGKEFKSKREGFIKVKTFDGKDIELNQRFIVSIKPKKIISIVCDITAHCNHRNQTCNSCIETRFFCIDLEDSIQFVNEYLGRNREKSGSFLIRRDSVKT